MLDHIGQIPARAAQIFEDKEARVQHRKIDRR